MDYSSGTGHTSVYSGMNTAESHPSYYKVKSLGCGAGCIICTGCRN